MIDKLRAAAQAVGDAKDILFLREMSVHDKVYLRLEDAINALKAALAEPAIKESLTVAEPVAFYNFQTHQMRWAKPTTYAEIVAVDVPELTLYTAPPRREWVGLTDEEIQVIHETYYRRMGPNEFAKLVEAKLKEKNT